MSREQSIFIQELAIKYGTQTINFWYIIILLMINSLIISF